MFYIHLYSNRAMWLWVPLDPIQHLFVALYYLKTSSLLSDMLLPMAAFQFSCIQGSVPMLNRPIQAKTLMSTQRLLGAPILVCCGTSFMSETYSVYQIFMVQALTVWGGKSHQILYHQGIVMSMREWFSDVETSTPYDKEDIFCY